MRMRPVATDAVAWSVCLSVHVSVGRNREHCKTDELFGLWTRGGLRNRVLYMLSPRTRRGTFEFWGGHTGRCPAVDILKVTQKERCGLLIVTVTATTCFLVHPIHRAFLPRDAMLARYMPWPCVCVCLSQVGVLLKWLNESSCFWQVMMGAFFHLQYPTLCFNRNSGTFKKAYFPLEPWT